MKNRVKRIAVDFAGYCLIILGLLTGWLPGPGGIPLILGGIGLLSINNHWARRLLHYIKENGDAFLKFIFPANRFVQALHDLLVFGLICAIIFLLVNYSGLYIFGVCIALGAVAVVDFIYNRDRRKFFKSRR